jgi:peptidoglycan/xylan/chitin deacetylase (PgdA/CDA1 family)
MGGLLTFSIEVELAWGNHDTREWSRLSTDGQLERTYLEKLLSVTARHEVPISFDVVGHLFLETCSGTHDGPHRPGWFAADPGTDRRTHGLFYAPDMIDDIRSTPVDHELCTHTFSHILFDEISDEVSAWELEQVQRLHRDRLGRPTRSLVPPRHQSPPYDVLADCGIDVVRPGITAEAATPAHRFKQLLAGPLPLSELRVSDAGIVETTTTTNPSLTAPTFPSGQGPTYPGFRPIPASVRHHYHLEKLKTATRTATETGGHLHLWCHLFDLSNSRQFAVVRAYFEWLAQYRRSNDVGIVTMNQLPPHAQ